jgi:GNAT superfamily N-acetyltransferase
MLKTSNLKLIDARFPDRRAKATPARSLTMVRLSNKPYPVVRLPEGFTVTWFQPGWETQWLEIQMLADPEGGVGPETHAKCFGAAPHELPRRQAFLIDPHGRPVGTATAWFDYRYQGRSWGRLHWVAVLPEFQGRRLGQAMLSVVCERMRSLHPEMAFLRTAAHRSAAIAVYLKFGFVPEAATPEEAARWRQALEHLQARPHSELRI